MEFKSGKQIFIWGLVFYFAQTVIVLFIDLLIGVYAEDLVIIGINTLVAGILGYMLTPRLLRDKNLSKKYDALKLGGLLGVFSVIIEILLSSLFFFNANLLRWLLTVAAASYGGKLAGEKR